MKKFIAILLVISMMAMTCAVIFAGTVTAFAAESNVAAVSDEYVPIEENSIGSKVAAIIVWLINAFRNSSNDAGPLSIIMEGIYQSIAKRYDVDSLMEWLNESGIVEWVTRIIFPR